MIMAMTEVRLAGVGVLSVQSVQIPLSRAFWVALTEVWSSYATRAAPHQKSKAPHEAGLYLRAETRDITWW
jgi:hypothetical protein